ncbi:MAG: dCTP deaminase [Candidatus Parvarchaeota archaeon]|nr:dCTP deaminase [Candidatus Parvarchaeota archaeon]
MILGNEDIKEFIEVGKLSISPLSDDTIRENGVDLRIGDEIIRFSDDGNVARLSDKTSIESIYKTEKIIGNFILGKNEKILIKIKERVKMPNNLVGFCNLRSTFARLGITIPPTIVDAGYEGYITIGVSGGAVPIEIGTGTRFLHLVFSTTKSDVTSLYSGVYQNSKSVSGAKV